MSTPTLEEIEAIVAKSDYNDLIARIRDGPAQTDKLAAEAASTIEKLQYTLFWMRGERIKLLKENRTMLDVLKRMRIALADVLPDDEVRE